MRIALTHNLKITGSPEEAEFDSPETIDAIAAALERAGHEVERIEVSGPASRVIARLEALMPDLIFNTAEGHKGKTREAFYPSLFEELGVPFTGSDAYTLCITLDKMLTKRILSAYGVPTPRARLVSRSTLESGALDDITFPVIVKPNFEGSSKGISGAFSVLRGRARARRGRRPPARPLRGRAHRRAVPARHRRRVRLRRRARERRDPRPGRVRDRSAGVGPLQRLRLQPQEREAGARHGAPGHAARVRPRAHPVAHAADRARARHQGSRAGCKFRVTPSAAEHGHDVHFLAVDALPSLEPGAGVFVGATRRGNRLRRHPPRDREERVPAPRESRTRRTRSRRRARSAWGSPTT